MASGPCVKECDVDVLLKAQHRGRTVLPRLTAAALQVRWAVIWSHCFKVINGRQKPQSRFVPGATAHRWMEECERSCLTSPWRPPERRQADRRQGSDEWVTSPRWRLPVCSGLFGQSGGKIRNRTMWSECAHKAEHTARKHVKESAARGCSNGRKRAAVDVWSAFK